jgi:hypothetical protein
LFKEWEWVTTPIFFFVGNLLSIRPIELKSNNLAYQFPVRKEILKKALSRVEKIVNFG